MSNELNIAQAQDTVIAGLQTFPKTGDSAAAAGVYTVICTGPDGQEKWSDTFHNQVVSVGLQDMNSKYFKGIGYTAGFYLGLIEGPGSGNTYDVGDTLSSHTGWTEFTDYTGSRSSVTFGTASTANPSVISNVATPNAFTISGVVGSATVAGAFLATTTDNSGVLFSEGNFTVGDKTVSDGDTLTVTYQFSLTAA
jgi:hypothetical protein